MGGRSEALRPLPGGCHAKPARLMSLISGPNSGRECWRSGLEITLSDPGGPGTPATEHWAASFGRPLEWRDSRKVLFGPMTLRDPVEENIHRLIRALVAGDPTETRFAYRELYRSGEASVVQLRQVLLKRKWKTLKHAEGVRYLCGFLALIRDIDESAAADVISALVAGGCGSEVEALARSVCRPWASDFRERTVEGVRCMVSHQLGDDQRICELMASWLSSVPDKDLTELEAIFVVPNSGDYDTSHYRPYLCAIRLLWLGPELPRGVRFFTETITQQTLYHEIGHHVHGHTFGQIREQEREADDYARRLMAQAHPNLSSVAWVFSRLRTRLGK